ncbi:MAG: hypothetical protein AAF483_01390, partial [Planctomycetota bacterium]
MRDLFWRSLARVLEALFGKLRPEELLSDLRKSVIFTDQFPNRNKISNIDFANLSDQEQMGFWDPSVTGIQILRESKENVIQISIDLREVADLPEAVPHFIYLWNECPTIPIRQAVGAQLLEIGSRECLECLAATLDQKQPLSETYPVDAVFALEKENAFDKLAKFFEPERLLIPGGDIVAQTILRQFIPPECVDEQLNWKEAKQYEWLSADPRWFDLIVQHLDHPVLNWWATEVLRHVDYPIVDSLLQQSKITPKSTSNPPVQLEMLIDRYQRGEHRQVWKELQTLDLEQEQNRIQALAVADATMVRVRHNIELLAERLADSGWVPLSGQIWGTPSSLATKKELIEQFRMSELGAIPPSLLAFWEHVGQVDCVWNYKLSQNVPDLCEGLDIPFSELDPLYVGGLAELSAEIAYTLFDWEENNLKFRQELRHQFDLPLAPDHYHKLGCSGASPYGIYLPCTGADPVFHFRQGSMPFVDYLREALSWGGFPLLKRYEELS